jgi:hypothetical protein
VTRCHGANRPQGSFECPGFVAIQQHCCIKASLENTVDDLGGAQAGGFVAPLRVAVWDEKS